jgi:HSP20 family protein
MATQQTQQDRSRQESASQPRGNERQLSRRADPLLLNPFGLLQQFNDDIARWFGDVARPRSSHRAGSGSSAAWMPKIDVVQRSNELVVRADLPGVSPDDVSVEVGDDAISISGERRQEHVDDSDGVYRVERSYGSFFREVPLPRGAIADQARAQFKDGVLEITIPSPSEQVSRGRRIEITRGEGEKKSGTEDTKR